MIDVMLEAFSHLKATADHYIGYTTALSPWLQVPARFLLTDFVKQKTSCNALYERQNDEVVNGAPAYVSDGGKWLCYDSTNKWWIIQNAKNKGTSVGYAHTSKGEHSAPWDALASWQEYDGDDDKKWHDAAVRVEVHSDSMKGEAHGECDSQPHRVIT